ncbi:MAG: hypothetical protein AAF483_03340 [Planctomycetota bacterium]
MNSKLLKAMLLGLICFTATSSILLSSVRAQDDFNIEMDLPEGSETFGTDDFSINTTVTEEQAAASAFFLAIISSACTGVPALLLGLVIGYFIGKGRSKKLAADDS